LYIYEIRVLVKNKGESGIFSLIIKLMASPRNDRFNKDDAKLAKYAKALSHPARIVILRQLSSLNTYSFSEISCEIPLADSTVSQHIHELKKAGLILDRYDPPKIRYSINSKNWRTARRNFKEFMKTSPGKAGENL
jgi:ArsR family transcriptional regulator